MCIRDSCSSDEGEETGGVKDTVVVAINGEPTKLTPYLDTSANNTICLLYTSRCV